MPGHRIKWDSPKKRALYEARKSATSAAKESRRKERTAIASLPEAKKLQSAQEALTASGLTVKQKETARKAYLAAGAAYRKACEKALADLGVAE